MIHQVVDLVITMNQCSSVLWLCVGISQEGCCVIVMGYLAYRFLAIHVDRLRLRSGDRAEGLYLAIIEAGRLTKVRKSHGSWRYSMQFRQSSNSFAPPAANEMMGSK